MDIFIERIIYDTFGEFGFPVDVSQDLTITEDGFIDVVKIYWKFKPPAGFNIFRNEKCRKNMIVLFGNPAKTA